MSDSPCVVSVRITANETFKRLSFSTFFALPVRYGDRVCALATCYSVFIGKLITPVSSDRVIIVDVLLVDVGC